MEHEFITPSTLAQNGMIERLIQSLKEGCVWQHTVQTFEDLRAEHSGLDVVAQSWAAAQRPGLSESGPMPGATISPGDLISWGHC